MTVSVLELAQTIADGILLGGMYSLEAMGLVIIFGVLKIINFAHGEFLLIGAYLMVVSFSINPILGPALAVPALLLLGFGVQKYILAKRAGFVTVPLIVTFGILLILQNVFLELFTANTVGVVTGLGSLVVRGVYLSYPLLIVFVCAMTTLVGIQLMLSKTYFGTAIRAATTSPEDAYLVGVDVRRIRLYAFMFGAALTGFAGSILVLQYPINPTAGLSYTMIAFTIIVLGGFNVTGVVVSGLLLGVVETLWGFFFPISYTNAVIYIIFLIAVIVRPSGLVGGGSS